MDSPRRPMAQAMHVFLVQFAILVQVASDDVVNNADVLVVQLVHHLIALSLVSRWFRDSKTPDLDLRAGAEHGCLAQLRRGFFRLLSGFVVHGSRSHGFMLRMGRPSGCGVRIAKTVARSSPNPTFKDAESYYSKISELIKC